MLYSRGGNGSEIKASSEPEALVVIQPQEGASRTMTDAQLVPPGAAEIVLDQEYRDQYPKQTH